MTDALIDPARLGEIGRLRLHEPDAKVLLDAAARRAAELLGLPTALVSIVLDDAQWFAGNTGLAGWLAEVGGTPVEWAFCTHVVRDKRELVVPDALADARFADNPLVTRAGIRCYVGVPIETASGHTLGSLCAVGPQVHALAPDQLGALRALAVELAGQLERRVSG